MNLKNLNNYFLVNLVHFSDKWFIPRPKRDNNEDCIIFLRTALKSDNSIVRQLDSQITR